MMVMNEFEGEIISNDNCSVCIDIWIQYGDITYSNNYTHSSRIE